MLSKHKSHLRSVNIQLWQEQLDEVFFKYYLQIRLQKNDLKKIFFNGFKDRQMKLIKRVLPFLILWFVAGVGEACHSPDREQHRVSASQCPPEKKQMRPREDWERLQITETGRKRSRGHSGPDTEPYT